MGFIPTSLKKKNTWYDHEVMYGRDNHQNHIKISALIRIYGHWKPRTSIIETESNLVFEKKPVSTPLQSSLFNASRLQSVNNDKAEISKTADVSSQIQEVSLNMTTAFRAFGKLDLR